MSEIKDTNKLKVCKDLVLVTQPVNLCMILNIQDDSTILQSKKFRNYTHGRNSLEINHILSHDKNRPSISLYQSKLSNKERMLTSQH